MSKLVENSLLALPNTEWGIDRGVLEIRKAVIIFTNFTGKANKFGNTSKNFNVVLPPDLKDYLEGQDIHVNIHKYPNSKDLGPDDPVLYYINVKVNMDTQFPPKVTLYVDKQTTDATGAVISKKSKATLTEETIGCLDRADLDRVDCTINFRESSTSPGNAVFYLRQLNAKQTKIPDFGGAWEDFDEDSIDPVEANPEIQAVEEFLQENK